MLPAILMLMWVLTHPFLNVTLWLFNIAMEKWPIEIDGLPLNSMVIFHGKMLNNQMVGLCHHEFTAHHSSPRILHVREQEQQRRLWRLAGRRSTPMVAANHC